MDLIKQFILEGVLKNGVNYINNKVKKLFNNL